MSFAALWCAASSQRLVEAPCGVITSTAGTQAIAGVQVGAGQQGSAHPTFILREWICRILARASSLGCGNSTLRSSRPDRMSAGSRMSARLVAAITCATAIRHCNLAQPSASLWLKYRMSARLVAAISNLRAQSLLGSNFGSTRAGAIAAWVSFGLTQCLCGA